MVDWYCISVYTVSGLFQQQRRALNTKDEKTNGDIFDFVCVYCSITIHKNKKNKTLQTGWFKNNTNNQPKLYTLMLQHKYKNNTTVVVTFFIVLGCCLSTRIKPVVKARICV